MSFDIIILRPTDGSVSDISDVVDVAPLGSAKHVSAVFQAVFPGCVKGVFVSGEDYALEAILSDDPVQSAHLALRSGAQWSDDTRTTFLAKLSQICLQLGSVAFAVSDNSRLVP